MFNLSENLLDEINERLEGKSLSEMYKNTAFYGCNSCQDYCHNHCSGNCGGMQKGWELP